MDEIIEPYFTLTSAAFLEGEHIPARYTCDGENISPQLEFGNLPEGSKSLALILEDPDAPNGAFTHWLIWNIAPIHQLMAGEAPGTLGRNDFGNNHYGGPCPPEGTHRFYFRAYALSQNLDLPEGSSKEALLQAMEPHLLQKAELMGKYNR